MTRMKAFRRGQWIGMLMFFCIMNLIQDWLGLEDYVDFLQRHWIAVPWPVWLLGLIIVGVAQWATLTQIAKEE
jgi:hypothetical protein